MEKKKRLKIALVVLDAVRSTFPETNVFIDSTLKEECKKERMIVDEVIFYKFRSKKISLDKHFCFRFRFGTIALIFCLQIWKGLANSKKTEHISIEEIKKRLIDMMIIEENLEFHDLNKEAEETQIQKKQQK